MSAARLAAGALDEGQLVARAAQLAPLLGEGGTLYLVGELGVGKTSFARALLRALGVDARIKSPTYSLLESYRSGDLDLHHLDLYRIADAGELEWLGLPELQDRRSLLLIEWPERGAGALPSPDLILRLQHAGSRRELYAEAASARGEWLLQHWAESGQWRDI